MEHLTGDDLRELRRERQRIGYGRELDQAALEALQETWEVRIKPDAKDRREWFAVVGPDSVPTGAAGPRWLFHLFGIAHRAAHIGLATPNGRVVLQRRSLTQAEWPGAWDMAVAGHVPQHQDGTPMSFLDAAHKELEEELGLPTAELGRLLAEGDLLPLGPPHFTYDQRLDRNPPFHNAESRQLYGATLTPDGLACLLPDYEELAGIYLCAEGEAWDLLAREPVASGLRFSLPRFLDWMAHRGAG